jgi:DNA-binding NarL/FixJ family response regulator
MRILVADDSDIVRRGIIDILSEEAEWNVCGEATNGSEALQKALELEPDLVLLDVSMSVPFDRALFVEMLSASCHYLHSRRP